MQRLKKQNIHAQLLKNMLKGKGNERGNGKCFDRNRKYHKRPSQVSDLEPSADTVDALPLMSDWNRRHYQPVCFTIIIRSSSTVTGDITCPSNSWSVVEQGWGFPVPAGTLAIYIFFVSAKASLLLSFSLQCFVYPYSYPSTHAQRQCAGLYQPCCIQTRTNLGEAFGESFGEPSSAERASESALGFSSVSFSVGSFSACSDFSSALWESSVSPGASVLPFCSSADFAGVSSSFLSSVLSAASSFLRRGLGLGDGLGLESCWDNMQKQRTLKWNWSNSVHKYYYRLW